MDQSNLAERYRQAQPIQGVLDLEVIFAVDCSKSTLDNLINNIFLLGFETDPPSGGFITNQERARKFEASDILRTLDIAHHSHEDKRFE
jgi:hypothetical protein